MQNLTQNQMAVRLGVSEGNLKYYQQVINGSQKYNGKVSDLEEERRLRQYAELTGQQVDFELVSRFYREQLSEKNMTIFQLKKFITKLAQKYNDNEAFDIGYNNKSLPQEPQPLQASQPVSKMEAYYQRLREGKAKPALKDGIPTETLINMKESGMTYEEIAFATGLSRSTVIYKLKEWREYKKNK